MAQRWQSSNLTEPERVIIFVDFDGTAARDIASQRLLERFADGDWQAVDEKLDRGEISFYECVRDSYGMLRGHAHEFEDFCATNLELRAGFVEFIKRSESKGHEIHIVAEALDFMIKPILKREGLDHLDLICDIGRFQENQLTEIEFPNKRADCACALGNCKGGHVRDHDTHEMRIFIGDGSNDFCAAQYCEVVFARRRLAELCNEHNIAYVPFEDFHDVVRAMESLGL